MSQREFADLERGTTVNVGIIRGGTRTNVVPENAEIEIDVRVKTEQNVPTPFLPTFSMPFSEDSSTRTASDFFAKLRIRSFDASLPTSSSGVIRMVTERFKGNARRNFMAYNEISIPDFMSKTPGPVHISPLIWNGNLERVPSGQTVS